MVKKILKRRKPPDIKTFLDAQMYAEQLGADVMEMITKEMTEDELVEALFPALKSAGKRVIDAAAIVQRLIDAEAGVGLAPLEPEFNPRVRTASLVSDILEAPLTAPKLVEKELVGLVDDTVRINAEAREELGLVTHITRTYSDVGLRNGTKYSEDCEWCKSRCGSWDNYRDAYEAGAFERHPGCLCEIDYHVKNTHTRSRGSYKWVNV